MAAAKEKTLSRFGPSCADLPLAASLELAENSRLGFERKNAALHLGQEIRNSTTALGIERGLLGNRVGSRIQTWNRYAYVGNNPTSFIDPSGLVDINAAMQFFASGGGGGGWQCVSASGGGQTTITSDGVDAICSAINDIINGGASQLTDNGSLQPSFFTPGGGMCQLHSSGESDTYYQCTGDFFSANDPRSIMIPPGVPKPPNPILKYDQCATAARKQAATNSTTIEIISGVSYGNTTLGCIGTGELFPACEAVLGGLELINLGVNWGAEQVSVWDGETACMQGH